MRIHDPKLRNMAQTLSLSVPLLSKEQTFIFYCFIKLQIGGTFFKRFAVNNISSIGRHYGYRIWVPGTYRFPDTWYL